MKPNRNVHYQVHMQHRWVNDIKPAMDAGMSYKELAQYQKTTRTALRLARRLAKEMDTL